MKKLSEKMNEVKKFMEENNLELIEPNWYRGHYPYWSDRVLLNNRTNKATVFEFVCDNQGGTNVNHDKQFWEFLHRLLIQKRRNYLVWLPLEAWKNMYKQLNEKDNLFQIIKAVGGSGSWM